MTTRAPLRIALLGAESTGKSTLAQALAERLRAATGLRVEPVDEWLRHWCEIHQRTPRAEEQAAIAAEQQARIDAAARTADIVIADTTPLMTAVYSELIFQDHSLSDRALAQQSQFELTLLMALDLPWQADGIQRDGPQVQAPVDQALRRHLRRSGLRWAVIGGRGEQRLEAALDALTPLLAGADTEVADAAQANGLFSRLMSRQQRLGQQRWRCECCDDPECELALKQVRSGA